MFSSQNLQNSFLELKMEWEPLPVESAYTNDTSNVEHFVGHHL